MTTTVTSAETGPLTANGFTPLPFTFQALSAEEIAVTRNGLTADPGSYTVAVSPDGTGTVTPLTDWGTDEVYIYSAPDWQQTSEFNRFGAFYPDQMNTPLDKLARSILALRREMQLISGGDDALLRADLNSAQGSSYVKAEDVNAPTYLKTVSDIINGLPIDMFRFVSQAKINGIRARSDSSDLTADFATALASGAKDINLQPGLYHVTDSIAMSTTGQRLNGAGADRCEINIASTTKSGITLANGVAGYGLRGFKLSRTGVPAATALGIECLGTTDKSILEWLVLEDHYTNLKLGTCDTGYVRNIETRRAYAYGVYQTNSAAYGPSQWDVDSVLMERNAVDGWRVQSTNGPAGLILGTMNNIRSFANGGRGIHLLGSVTTPIYDLRLSNAFLGSDAAASIRLDTYGGKHRMTGFFERSGRDPTGRTLATAASNTAPNIEISANNIDTTIYGSTIDDAAYDGIQHDGGILIVTACMVYNNGQAGTAGRRNGVLSNGGELIFNGNKACNIGGNVSQLYGIATAHSDVVINGNSLKNNVTGGTSLGSTTNAVQLGNSPAALTGYLPAAIDKLQFNSAWTPTATGGDKGAGTVNVASGTYKNNVAYVNP